MGSTSVYATSTNGHYVYADITWDDDLKVTVNLTDVNAGWCIKIRGTSTIVCSGSSSNRIDTFYADEGQDYVLQVYDIVNGSFFNNGDPIFTVSSNSSGGSSGGDSGGTTGVYKLVIYTDGIATVTVTNVTTGAVLTNGANIYHGDVLRVNFSAPNGYELDGHYVDNWEFASGDTLTVIHYIYIDASAKIIEPKGFPRYQCYIEAENAEYAYTENCDFVGHAYIDADYLNSVSAPIYSTSGSKYVGYNNNGSPYKPVYFLKFITPKFSQPSKCMNFVIPMSSSYGVGTAIKYWISTSDENYLTYATYAKNGNAVIDENMIIEGTYSIPVASNQLEISIFANSLESNKTYYLILWVPYQNSYGQQRRLLSVPTSISIDYNSKWGLYECYIDTGTRWELFNIHIENQG